MALAPRRPLGELSTLRREMDRLFERFFGEVLSLEQPGGTWEPRLDIADSRDLLTVKAELPGLEAKDLDVSVSGDTLPIKGRKNRRKRKRTSVDMSSNGATAPSHARCGCRRP